MIFLETPLEHSQGGSLINQIIEGLIVQPFCLEALTHLSKFRETSQWVNAH